MKYVVHCLEQLNCIDHHLIKQIMLYELLSEYQATMENLKIQRHGIHYHVQYRNVHSTIQTSSYTNTNDTSEDCIDKNY
ncbi:unnamed protein product [Schistosoma turkestanicum]|nr:unnamed protein product [Schistosoma turkestanicum]